LKIFNIKVSRFLRNNRRVCTLAGRCNLPLTENIDTSNSKRKNGGLTSIIITAGIILAGILIVSIFKEDINKYGVQLIHRYGSEKIDVILLLITAISCSPICLPVWQYVLVGIAMGYAVLRLAMIMALGAAMGSVITYYFGRYFGKSRFISNRFPKAREHPWIHGRSKWYVSLVLFFGTASPIPFDILYFACGIKRYPFLLLFVICASARFVRYLYLGYGFEYFSFWY